MRESDPNDSPQEKSDIEIFWGSFFVYLEKISELGIEIDQDKVIEIAKLSDPEAAQRFLFYSILHGRPRRGGDVSVIREIIDFLIERGYIDTEGGTGSVEEL